VYNDLLSGCLQKAWWVADSPPDLAAMRPLKNLPFDECDSIAAQ
jgi:hypothetical protein